MFMKNLPVLTTGAVNVRVATHELGNGVVGDLKPNQSRLLIWTASATPQVAPTIPVLT